MNFSEIERAQLLLHQNRPEEAEKILMNALASMPDSAIVKYLLSECKFDKNENKASLEFINEAIASDPEDADFYALKSRILSRLNQPKQAIENIEQAINLEPEHAFFWGIKAALLFDEKRYEEALEASDNGLTLDPEQTICLNFRSLSLAKLSRTEEAEDTIKDTLKIDPNDSFSYSSQGYIFLQKGKAKEALDMFKEALSINPENTFAKAGLIEAMKSRFIFYRIFYMLFDWLGRQGRSVQWGVIIGIFVINRLSGSIAENYPALAPVFNCISYALFTFVILTWIITPLSNLFLSFNSYGKYALSKTQLASAYWTGAILFLVLCFIAGSLILKMPLLIITAMLVLFMVLPVNYIYNFKDTYHEKQVLWTSVAIIILGIATIVEIMFGNTFFLPTIFFVAMLIYQFRMIKLAI